MSTVTCLMGMHVECVAGLVRWMMEALHACQAYTPMAHGVHDMQTTQTSTLDGVNQQ